MYKIIDFYLVTETKTTDSMGQVISTKSNEICVGKLKSVYEKEFYQAAQVGIRPSFVIETPSSNYNGQALIKYEGKEYSVYRTYLVGTDKIELYCQEKVGDQ